MAITELDVGIPGAITSESLIAQGWYYAELFELFREYPDLFSVTLWGPYDSRSWRADGAPLPFDSSLQAKHAYWGVVDPDELPIAIQVINAHHGEIEPGEDATSAPEWDLLPEHSIGTEHGFSVRWTEEHLNVLVRIVDDTDEGGDLVSIFAGDEQFDVGRDGTSEVPNSVVTGTNDGYLVFAQIPLAGLAEGEQVPFDVRISDDGEPISWNDLNHTQESGEDLGVLSLVEPVAFVQVPHAEQALVIDAEEQDWQIDPAWEEAPAVRTEVQVEGSPGAEAEVRMLWHDDRLYALLEVADAELDRTNSNAWEQDSVEIFLDPVNAKSGPYNTEDGQYRINFDNQVSFGGEEGIGDNLTSRTQVTEEGYWVEVALDLGYPAEVGQFLGVEFQVNDATGGDRTSVRTWTDPTGLSYQDTSRWGVAQLVSETDDGNGDDGNGDDGNGDDASPRIELSADRVEPGDTLIATGINFAADEQISGLLESDPIELGSVTANADGVVVFTIELPLDIDAGQHTLTLTGEVSGQAVATFEVLEVSGATDDDGEADAGAGSGLPATGTTGLATLVLLALLALLAGGTGVMLRRRRVT